MLILVTIQSWIKIVKDVFFCIRFDIHNLLSNSHKNLKTLRVFKDKTFETIR